ncbi:hypothetical protein UlMin_012275 [Ulmus minor]
MQVLPSTNWYQSLTVLIIQDFGSLKYLFPSSVAVNFVQLHRITISKCKMMEEIVTMDQRMDKLLLPRLKYLELKDLAKVTRFCSGTFLELPLLTDLEILDCPQFLTCSSISLSTDMPENNLCTYTLSLFNDKVAVPSLEKMDVRNLDNMKMIWQDGVFADCLCKLKVVEVKYCKNLEKMFSFSDEVLYGTIFSDLEELQLLELPNLLRLLEENSQSTNAFQRLEMLQVLRCCSLKSLAPSAISFQNLTYLVVSKCDGMVNLLSFSTAKSLAQLRVMIVTGCNRMTEIIAKEGGEIIFNQLEILVLHGLPSLKSFHSGIVRFPQLKEMIVSDCPEMQSFCYDAFTPNLDRIITMLGYQNYFDRISHSIPVWQLEKLFIYNFVKPEQELWGGDINSTLQEVWKNDPGVALQRLFSEQEGYYLEDYDKYS